MEQLRIAFYSDAYLPAVDGVVKSIINFKNELERKGHEVYIFASGDSESIKKLSNSHVFITQGVNFRPYPQYKAAIFPYQGILKLASLKVDIIHAHTPFMMGFSGLMASKLAGYPIVGSFHTMINDRAVINSYHPKNKHIRKFTSKYLWKYTKFFYRRCDATIAPSASIEKMLNKLHIGNTFVVPNGVDVSRFIDAKEDGIRSKIKVGKNKKIVLFVGRVSKEKRLDTLLRAAHIISKYRNDVAFVIAGSGPAEIYYKSMAQRLGLGNVVFTGFIPEKILPNLYAASDVFVMPSTFETQNVASIEAMAAGKPVVGANSLALAEIIKSGKNGEKFAPGDYIGCAKKIENVLNSSETYKEGAISTAKNFSIEKTTDKLIKVYENILIDKNGRFTE
ncbi:MAG: glycosyltransferase [Candidatus Micrarchaeia archaeon]